MPAVARAPLPVEMMIPQPPRAPLVMQLSEHERWDKLIASFDEVCQEQTIAFAASRWPGVALEPQLFRRGGEIVGGALVMIQPLPLRLGTIAVVKWGPMRAATQERDAYGEMIDNLMVEYADKRGMMLSVLPHSGLAPGDNADAWLLSERGFRKGSALLYPDRYVVNLQLSEVEIRASFDQKWRYHLNKSEKADLVFERVEASELPRFTTLYNAMLDRKRFPDHSAFATLDRLMAIDDARLRPELFFVTHQGKTVAGAVIFKSGKRTVYLYGATDDAALSLRAGYFMHWHIIRWLKANTGAEWYDLGGTDGFHGLHQFKKGMVGSAGLIVPVPPVMNFAARPLARLAGEAAFAAREWKNILNRLVDRLRPDRAKPDQQRRDNQRQDHAPSEDHQ